MQQLTFLEVGRVEWREVPDDTYGAGTAKEARG